jgi:hypothetical protein
MRDELAHLRAELQNLKKASVFRKALVAEAAIGAAVDVLEKIIVEIEALKSDKKRVETSNI